MAENKMENNTQNVLYAIFKRENNMTEYKDSDKDQVLHSSLPSTSSKMESPISDDNVVNCDSSSSLSWPTEYIFVNQSDMEALEKEDKRRLMVRAYQAKYRNKIKLSLKNDAARAQLIREKNRVYKARYCQKLKKILQNDPERAQLIREKNQKLGSYYRLKLKNQMQNDAALAQRIKEKNQLYRSRYRLKLKKFMDRAKIQLNFYDPAPENDA